VDKLIRIYASTKTVHSADPPVTSPAFSIAESACGHNVPAEYACPESSRCNHVDLNITKPLSLIVASCQAPVRLCYVWLQPLPGSHQQNWRNPQREIKRLSLQVFVRNFIISTHVSLACHYIVLLLKLFVLATPFWDSFELL
jgi:hypothetical protein